MDGYVREINQSDDRKERNPRVENFSENMMIQTIGAIFIRDHDSTIQLLREINRLTWKNGTSKVVYSIHRVKVCFLYDKILEITGLHRRLLSTAGGGPLISILRAVDTIRRKSGGKNGYRATGAWHTIAEIKVASNGARIGAYRCNMRSLNRETDRTSGVPFSRSRRETLSLRRHWVVNYC